MFHVWPASCVWNICSLLQGTNILHSTHAKNTQHYTLLHFIAIYYGALQQYILVHYTRLHCPVVHYTTMHCCALQYTALYCGALPYNSLYYGALLCTALYCGALQCSALYCGALQYIANRLMTGEGRGGGAVLPFEALVWF